MNIHIRNGLRVGVIFGITTIFLVLIGFEITGTRLLSKVFGNAGATDALSTTNLLIFMGLLGFFAGTAAARRTERDTWSSVLQAGLAAGISYGFWMALFTLLIGSIHAQGIDMRKYLAALSPQELSFYLFNQIPRTAALYYFIFFLITPLFGALIAKLTGRSAARSAADAKLSDLRKRLNQIPSYSRLKASPYLRYASYAVILGIVLLTPLIAGQYWNYTLGTVGIYVLLGLGLNIVVGLAGLLDLGYVAFFAIGAYTVALLTAPEPHNLQWSFWAALPVAVIISALAGILLGVPVLRLRGDYLAIVTLGFGEIIRILSKSDVLMDFTAGPRGVRAIAQPTLFGKAFDSDVAFMYIIILACLFIIFVTNRLQNSRTGRAWIAMREDETVAQAMGINTWKAKLLAFAVGAAFAGLGGAIFASRNQFTGPEDFNLMVSINVLCEVIVGGMGSILGVIAGAFVLKGLPEILRELENYRILAFGALLVVMMIIRPEGIIPSARRRLEIRSEQEEFIEEELKEELRTTKVTVSQNPSSSGQSDQ
jgi:ABC-type branched-subunit amino acid transport system permease subunit